VIETLPKVNIEDAGQAKMSTMGVADQLRIDVRREADRVVVRLEGELDLASAPLLHDAIESAGEASSTLVLDLQDLQFIDSTGLRTILWARERCQGHAQEFAMTPGSEQVQRLLAISGAGEHLRVIASADEMLV
jgi:anti-anti-sigma factor